MSKKTYMLKKENVKPYLEEMGKSSAVYVPAQDTKNFLFNFFNLSEIGSDLSFDANGPKRYRLNTLEKTKLSPKHVLFPQFEKMLDFNFEKNPDKLDEVKINIDDAADMGKSVLFGLKPCDTEAIKRMDKVFTEGIVKDPYYAAKRENTLLITIGCNVAFEDCFCTMTGGSPYHFAHTDIGLMEVEGGYAVMALSEKGAQAIEENSKYFEEAEAKQEAYAEQMAANEKKTSDAIQSLWDGIAFAEIPKIMDASFEIASWKKVSEKCISCGACTFACPTCYCFDIRDEQENMQGQRFRCWDFCTNYLYTLEASGHNPRKDINKRYKNKINCKYNYNFKRHDELLYCVGCGRCVDVCPADMDIRQIVDTILKNSKKS